MRNFEMVIGVGKEQGKWMILLRRDSLAKLVQDILCQFTPPQKIIILL